MNSSALLPFTGGCWTRAKILEQLLYWNNTTNRQDDMGRPVILPFLNGIGRKFDLHKSTVSRALKWLAQQGYISLRTIWINRVKRLQIRVLIRPRATPPCNTPATPPQHPATLHTPDTLSNSLDMQADTGSAGKAEMVLKPPLPPKEVIEHNIQQKRENSRARDRLKPATPQVIAYEWDRLLSEYGYQRIDPTSGKHLKHIAKTIQLFGNPTIGGMVNKLEYRISMWMNSRPKHLGKAPPHPWAINRTHLLFENMPEPGHFIIDETSVPEAQPLHKTPVDNANSGGNEPAVVLGSKKGGLMHLFKSKAEK